MATGQKSKSASSEGADESNRRVCGIVMPISAMGDYSEEHWKRVRRVIQKSIERAGLRWQLVWENGSSDVIQSAILKNIYENDVIICDLSGLNPNVMLETGLRLSTKKPTILITDGLFKPPFDIGVITYHPYPKDLEYNATSEFINNLSQKIKEIIEAGDSYKSFVDHFRFETVTPSTVSVTFEDYIKERFDTISGAVARLERRSQSATRSQPGRRSPRKNTAIHIGSIIANLDEDAAKKAEESIDDVSGIYCIVSEISDNQFEFSIRKMDYCDQNDRQIMALAKGIIDEAEVNFLLGE